MSDHTIPLLSIVIPTKNRQFTCLYAIETALLINNDDFEVIVQDCSDTNILQQQIQDRFGMDQRIKYFYSDEKLTMTDNWNRAFANTTAEYIAVIGDDDAVLPAIYEIAKWARQSNINMIKHRSTYYCSWPGNLLDDPKGYLTYNNEIKVTGTFSITRLETNILYEYCSLKNPLIYLSLPNVYHCLISRSLMDAVKKDTGILFDSTSLDAYIGVVLFKYLKEYAVVDYPFTLAGSAPNSNTHRNRAGNIALGFKEYVDLKFPDFVPNVYSLSTSIAESIYTACKNSHQEELLKKIDLPHMYANIFIESKGNFKAIFKKLQQYKKGNMDYVYFLSHIIRKLSKRSMLNLKESAKKNVQKYFPAYFKKLHSKYSITGSHQIENSMDAVSIIRDQLKDCKLMLN